MRLIRLALVGTTSLLLAVSTHAAEGDWCKADSGCTPAACCDGTTGKCGAGPAESVGAGNAAAQPCECMAGEEFKGDFRACGDCSSNEDCQGDLCCDVESGFCSMLDLGSIPASSSADFACACAPGLLFSFGSCDAVEACSDNADCEGDLCCDVESGFCSTLDLGSISNSNSADFACACAAGSTFNSILKTCGDASACDPADSVCDDPHMQGLRGQKIDWSGVNGGWYSLIKDEQADLHINVQLTAPLPDEFPDRQLVTGLGIVSEGHSLAIEVRNPYTIDTDGCKNVYPCLANGGLRALVDGNDEDGLLRFSRGEYVTDGIAASASNLPVECRQFGADKIWASMYDEMLQGKRTLAKETIEDWILKSESMAAPEWCAKYISENDLADLQSTHAIFKIQTSTVAVRLNIGINYQGGGELDWDGRVLPDLEFWQMDVGLDGLNIDNPSLSGILGETARPVYDENGVEVMEGFEAFRGTVEDYHVSGALGTHFALLDKLEEGHE